MLTSLIILLFIYLMGLVFIVGVIIFIIGLFLKDEKNKIRNAGIKIGGFPIVIILLIFIFDFINEAFTLKPDIEDLVGTYNIVKVTHLDIDKTKYEDYELKFNHDSTFTLTPTPFIEVCDSGKFNIGYKFKSDELLLKCPNFNTFANINRGFGNFKIEFTIGDPDSGKSIFFKKISD